MKQDTFTITLTKDSLGNPHMRIVSSVGDKAVIPIFEGQAQRLEAMGAQWEKPKT